MAFQDLAGLRLLIVEDEYFLADDARTALSEAGAEVLSPVASARDARALIEGGTDIDAVLLDVNLRGEKAFDVADVLRSRAIPFAFVTGYDRAAMPARFSDATSLEKPVRPDQIVSLVKTLVA